LERSEDKEMLLYTLELFVMKVAPCEVQMALMQGFPTCGTRVTSIFFTKTWIHSFLVYVSGFVSE